jgi:hypothetical protein
MLKECDFSDSASLSSRKNKENNKKSKKKTLNTLRNSLLWRVMLLMK